MADGPTIVRGALRSRDTDLMVAGLRGAWCRASTTRPTTGLSYPRALRGPADIDCGLAGTVTRFLVAIASLAQGQVRFDGDPRARERPMRPLLDGMRQLGVRIDDDGRYSLPLAVFGTGQLPGGECVIDSSTSSQFISALLLAAPRATGPIVVRHVGPALPSLPHIEMTVAMLRGPRRGGRRRRAGRVARAAGPFARWHG